MTSVDEVSRLFKAAHDSHVKVYSMPYYDDVISFKEDLLNVCLKISFEGTDVVNPSGAILEDARYKRVNMTGTSYDRQLAARKIYDGRITINDPLCRSKE